MNDPRAIAELILARAACRAGRNLPGVERDQILSEIECHLDRAVALCLEPEQTNRISVTQLFDPPVSH
jgi:hypothetical protein